MARMVIGGIVWGHMMALWSPSQNSQTATEAACMSMTTSTCFFLCSKLHHRIVVRRFCPLPKTKDHELKNCSFRVRRSAPHPGVNQFCGYCPRHRA
eukprot:8795848-Pyramimonas_sp.AAC.1